MNLALVPVALLVILALPEAGVVLYLAFYYLLWLFLPAIVLLLILTLHQHGKPRNGQLDLGREKRAARSAGLALKACTNEGGTHLPDRSAM